MRAFLVAALLAFAGAAAAAHVQNVPLRSRHAHVGVARGLSETSSSLVSRAADAGLKRRKRCAAAAASSSTKPAASAQVSTKNTTPSTHETSSSTETRPAGSETSSHSSSHAAQPSSSSSKTKSTTQAKPTGTATTPENVSVGSTLDAAQPAYTRGTSADPYLTELSRPLNYSLIPDFTASYSGQMTFYDTGSVACGDTYTDSTLTAAVSHIMYDEWPGSTPETNRNPMCGPFVKGRYFLDSSDVKVPGSAHATIGGDYLINCTPGEQRHTPLTATVHNPSTGLSVTVALVDRCASCAKGDIDMSPTAFLKITRPELLKVPGSQRLAQALTDPYGRINVTWKFDSVQKFGPVVSL